MTTATSQHSLWLLSEYLPSLASLSPTYSPLVNTMDLPAPPHNHTTSTTCLSQPPQSSMPKQLLQCHPEVHMGKVGMKTRSLNCPQGFFGHVRAQRTICGAGSGWGMQGSVMDLNKLALCTKIIACIPNWLLLIPLLMVYHTHLQKMTSGVRH